MPSLPRHLRGEVATAKRDFIYPAYDGTEAWGRDEVLREEGGYGYRRWDIYTRLLIDAHVGAVFQKRWGAIVGREWEMEPGDKSFKARKAAEMCEAQLKAMGSRPPMWEEKNELVIGPASAFDEGILALQSSILYGLAPVENMWAQDGNEVYIESLFPRDIRRFMMVAGPRGYRLRLRVQDAPAYGESLDPRKFTVARYCYLPTEDPWGLGKGAQLFYPTWAKKNCAKFWLIFADKMGNPTSVAKVPQGTKPEKRAEYLTMLQAIASDAGIVIDDNVSLEFAAASASGANQTHSGLIDWANDEISKAVLSETGTTDQSRTGGSRAQDEVANEQRLEVAKADADMLSNLLNRTLLRHITYFNFGDGVASPRIWWKFPELEERMDRQKEAQVVVSLAGAGYPATRDWVEEKFEIELDEVADQESPLGSLFAGDEDSPINGGPEAEQVDLAEGEADPVQAMLQTALASAPKSPLLGKVAGLLDEAESLQQVQAELPDLLGEVSQDFSDVLAGAIATAGLQGRWEVVGEGLEDEVIDNAETTTARAVPDELPDDPSPKQLQALVVAIAREEFEPDAVAAGPVEFTTNGWKMLYSSVKSRNRQFLLEWDGDIFTKGLPGVEDDAPETEDLSEADPLEFAARRAGPRRKAKCNAGKSHFCKTPNGSGSCVSLSKNCRYKGGELVRRAANYISEAGSGGTPAAAEETRSSSGGGASTAPAEAEAAPTPPASSATRGEANLNTLGDEEFDDILLLEGSEAADYLKGLGFGSISDSLARDLRITQRQFAESGSSPESRKRESGVPPRRKTPSVPQPVQDSELPPVNPKVAQSSDKFKVGKEDINLSIIGGDVAFDVGGDFNRGGLSGSDARKVLAELKTRFNKRVAGLEDGQVLSTTAWTQDGGGRGRTAAYQKMGFGDPKVLGGVQYGIVKGGKLLPLTQQQVSTLGLEQTFEE